MLPPAVRHLAESVVSIISIAGREVDALAFRVSRNRTVSRVFCISGILSFKPVSRLSWLACMNWYLLV